MKRHKAFALGLALVCPSLMAGLEAHRTSQSTTLHHIAAIAIDSVRPTDDAPTRLREIAVAADKCLARTDGHIGDEAAACVCSTVSQGKLRCFAAKAYLAFYGDIPLRQGTESKYYGLAYVPGDSTPTGTENIEIFSGGYGVLLDLRIGLPPHWYLIEVCKRCD
jgi:hypothetical protein